MATVLSLWEFQLKITGGSWLAYSVEKVRWRSWISLQLADRSCKVKRRIEGLFWRIKVGRTTLNSWETRRRQKGRSCLSHYPEQPNVKTKNAEVKSESGFAFKLAEVLHWMVINIGFVFGLCNHQRAGSVNSHCLVHNFSNHGNRALFDGVHELDFVPDWLHEEKGCHRSIDRKLFFEKLVHTANHDPPTPGYRLRLHDHLGRCFPLFAPFLLQWVWQ